MNLARSVDKESLLPAPLAAGSQAYDLLHLGVLTACDVRDGHALMIQTDFHSVNAPIKWKPPHGTDIVSAMHVFTYGSLMFSEVWSAVVGESFATVAGQAHGYAIYRVRGAVFPGITATDGGVVNGIVYLDVDADSCALLDRFEDDFYDRKTISIACADGRRRSADAYVISPGRRDVLTDEPWDSETFVSSGGLEPFISRFAGFERVAERG